MSIEWMNTVLDRSEPKGPPARLVLLLLADMANNHGVCWPSVEYLARRGSLHPRTVQRALRQLETDGLILTKIGAGKHSSCYQLLAPEVVADSRGGGGSLPGGVVADSRGGGGRLPPKPSENPNKNPQGTGGHKAPPPSLEEWLEYCESIGYPDLEDAKRAWLNYESVGWRRGQGRGLEIQNWQRAAQTCRSFCTGSSGGSRSTDGGPPANKKLAPGGGDARDWVPIDWEKREALERELAAMPGVGAQFAPRDDAHLTADEAWALQQERARAAELAGATQGGGR